ncbi:MAG: right-handed parallel beta-helix repeat-containing protein [Chloroflexota bacterium]|nr:right-handed parallel beta-helix repeat-containing protein [Chloroflexota bacterium]
MYSDDFIRGNDVTNSKVRVTRIKAIPIFACLILVIGLWFLLIWFPLVVNAATTWYVDDDRVEYPEADFSTIQDAVNSASDGDTIVIYPGSYVENMAVDKDLTIRADVGPEVTVIEPSDPDVPVFNVEADLRLEGLSIQYAGTHGVNSVGASLDIDNVLILGSDQYAIQFTDGRDFTLKNTTIEHNGGGVVFTNDATGDVWINECIIGENGGDGLSIRLAQSGDAALEDIWLENNADAGLSCQIAGTGGTASLSEITANNNWGHGLVLKGANNAILKDISVHSAGVDCFYMEDCFNLSLLAPFTFQGAAENGIKAVGSDLYAIGGEISNNIGNAILFIDGGGFQLEESRIELNGGGVEYLGNATGDAVLVENQIWNNGGNGVHISMAAGGSAELLHNIVDMNIGIGLGCIVHGRGGSVQIQNNEVRENGEYGIYLEGLDNSELSHTNIDGAGQSGIHLRNCSRVSINRPFMVNGASSHGIEVVMSSLQANGIVVSDNNGSGIWIESGTGITLEESIIENNSAGIEFRNTASGITRINDNHIDNNFGNGIQIKLVQGSEATVTGNSIENNFGDGLECSIAGSGGHLRANNNVVRNVGADGIRLEGVYDSELVNIVIEETGGNGLYLNKCWHVDAKAPFVIQNVTLHGIMAVDSELNAEGITIRDCGGYGIGFRNGNKFRLEGAIIEDNGGGVEFRGFAKDDAIILNNTIRGNSGHGLYVLIDQTKSTSVTNNLIDGHDGVGVHCEVAGVGGAVRVVDNVVVNTSGDGVRLKGNSEGEVVGNTIMYAKKHGLSLLDSYGSHIYLNNFSNNIDDVYIHNSTITWNSSDPLPYIYDGVVYMSKLGNYWDSYQGEDGDNNGIGDVPQMLDDEQDDYPIVFQFILGDPSMDGVIDGHDLVVVKRIILGDGYPTPQADCDRNGLVDGRDLICIEKKILDILH